MHRTKPIYLAVCLAIGVISVSLAACSAAQPADTEESQSSVTLAGSINAASVQRLKETISTKTKRLVVNSAGGRAPEAIELGALVRSRNLEVVVDGLCLSACAHFVFLPARKKRVEADSIVAFHHTTTALHDFLIASGRPDLAAAYLPFATQEQAFYKSAGIAREVLEEPFENILPICYREMEGAAPDSEYRTAIFTKFGFYVPALADLYKHGVAPIEGYWPSSTSDLERSLSRYPKKPNTSFKIKLRSSGVDDGQEARALPICPDDPAYRLPDRGPSAR